MSATNNTMDGREKVDVKGDTVIIGAGIVGLSTAYYLTESGNARAESVHLVDSSDELLRCASGFSGGFLASDWFAPSIAPLGALSYNLHKSLAETHNGRKIWGYSISTSMSLSQQHESDAAVGGSGKDWLTEGGGRYETAPTTRKDSKSGIESQFGPKWLKDAREEDLEEISTEGKVAQIDPLRFCQWLIERCRERGVKFHQPARVLSVSKDEEGMINGVRISEKGTESELPCTRVVITAGAWSPRVFATLFPKSRLKIPVTHLAGHSLLIKNHHFNHDAEDDEVCHAVFAAESLGFSPEWFSRIGGELYLAGLNTTMIPLPETVNDIKPDSKSIDQMKQCAMEMIKKVEGKEMEVLREALCFRPLTSNGRPILCRMPDAHLCGGMKTRKNAEGGVFIAAGHGAWGISLAPGTGLVLSELIEGRKPSVNITALDLEAFLPQAR